MKIALLAMALGLCLGCETELQMRNKPTIHFDLKFKRGQIIDLKIGGRGQVIKVAPKEKRPYYIRIRTDNGPVDIWMNEFELRVNQWEPS